MAATLPVQYVIYFHLAFSHCWGNPFPSYQHLTRYLHGHLGRYFLSHLLFNLFSSNG